MKSVLVVVSIIAVFSADCRDFPDKSDLGPEYLDEHFPEESVGTKTAEEHKNINDKTDIRGFADEAQNFPGEPMEHESAVGIQVSNDGSQGLYQQFIEESEGLNTAQLRGKQQNKILKQIVKDLDYIKEEVQSVKKIQDNTTVTDKEIKMKLQSIRDHQNNFTDMAIGKEIRDELRSVMGNITDNNSELKKEVSSMKQNIDNKISLIVSKLDYIHVGQGCPRGFILIDNQCYKYLLDQEMNWKDADERCRSLGLTLAQPRDPIGLRKYMLENYADYHFPWLGARGTGSVFQWQRGGQVLSSSSAYWWRGYPGHRTSSDYCLGLLTRPGDLKLQPNNPYYPLSCTQTEYPLCEKM